MIDYDAKVFWRYFLHLLNPRRVISSNSFYYYLILFIVAFEVMFTNIGIRMKSIIAGIGFLIIVFMQVYRLYKSGEHRYWDRQRMGILSKSEIRDLKEKEKQDLPAIKLDIEPKEIEPKIAKQEVIIKLDKKDIRGAKGEIMLELKKEVKIEPKEEGISNGK